MHHYFEGKHGSSRGGGFARGAFGKGFGRGLGGAVGHGGGGGRGPGGGRRRRLFTQAELQTLLLALVAEQPRHGYDLIKEIETLSGGEYAPSPGVVYPALTYMEEQGAIAVVQSEGSARKCYEATDDGRRQITEDAKVVLALRERLTALAANRDKTDPAPVRRAMHSMKTAVFDQLSHENVSRETVLAVAEIIDEAARKIERIEL